MSYIHVDPCQTYGTLGASWRLTGTVGTIYDYRCDRYLTEGWYRFIAIDSSEFGDLSYSAQVQSNCGTYHPVWWSGE